MRIFPRLCYEGVMLERVRGREALILACCIWAFHALLEMSIANAFLVIALIWATHGLALMLVMGAILNQTLRIRSLLIRLAACAVLALVFTLVQTALDLLVTLKVGDLLLHEVSPPPGMTFNSNDLEFQTAFKLNFKYYIWLFGFYAAILALLAASREKWAASLTAQRARIEALRLQINPHFLFNALTSMEGLMVLGRTDDATRMLHSLSDFYRSTLLDRDDTLTPLAEELDVLQDYAAVERIRFGDRLHLAIEDMPDIGGVLVPPLLLQPLVENAIKHGDDGSSPIQVEVAVRLEPDRLAIVVRNPLRVSPRHPGTGTGLANVHRRLGLLYGADAGLEAGPQDGAWQARVWLPRGSG